MGLDMYLTRQTYVKNWDHMTPEERIEITITGERYKAIKTERISEIVEEVCYWRKANQIHAWFVRECQDGVDECQHTFVPDEKIVKLVETCKAVLADPTKAAELLPPQAGFFFGGTEIDDYYFDDLRHTVAVLEPVLAEQSNSGDFYYHSSW